MKKLLAALLFMPLMSHAAFRSGNELLSDMNATDSFSRGLALGYIMSAADMARSVWFCPPSDGGGLTAGQIHDVVRNYLTNNPVIRNRAADSILIEVFSSWYPCRNRGGTRS